MALTIGHPFRAPAAAARLSSPAPAFAAGLALCLAAVGPAWGADDKAPAAPTAAKAAASLKQAQALMRAGRFGEALAILRPLLRGDPDARRVAAGVVFHIGLAAVGAAQKRGLPEKQRNALLDEAIAIFRTMLVHRPGLVRIRLELARAFFAKGEDTLARRHFERVLAGKPPAAVAANVNRFLLALRARKRWSVNVGVALAPDSNISSRTEGQTIVLNTPIGRLPFSYRSDDRPTSGIGLAIWAGAEYQHPLAQRWRLRMGGNVSRREYQSDEFDRMFVGAHVGPRWLISRTTEASLLASARLSWLSDEPDFRDLGLRFEGRRRLNRRTAASFNASWHDRRYPGRPWLNGPVVDLASGIGWAATPTIRLNGAGGWGSQTTDNERQRHAYRWVRAGASAQLPWGFTAGGSGTFRWTDYEGNWAPFVLGGGARRDRTWSIRLNVLNRALTFRGFSPQISAVYERRTSNAQLHDYKRISGELRFVRLF